MREPIGRRQALRRLGAPAVAPLLLRFHPSVPPEASGWKPKFLHESELATVTELAERIIPETDTPGARGALVHQYIDFMLARGEAPGRERFRAGLASLDRRCRDLFGQPFASLEASQQDDVLKRVAQAPASEDASLVAFFREMKRLTVDGYYRSEAGMKQELGFEGRTFLAEFQGCTHPEHRSWKVGD